MIAKVGIVVPTLGTRTEYLRQCLESIQKAGPAFVCLVAPANFDAEPLKKLGLVHQHSLDKGKGLSEAINQGVEDLPQDVEYVNWLGDDDLLEPRSLKHASQILDDSIQTVLVYGSCNYIDSKGEIVWKNKSGPWASPLLHFGPDLIPQPGALFRRSAFDAAGGLSPAYDWAFDFDLLLKLKKQGKLKFVNQTLASFRWHPESLSVEFRKMSVDEASQVRISHLPSWLRPISWLWEYPVKKATLVAGNRVTKRAQRLIK